MRVKTEKKRNEIIAIAGELFLSQGYGGVSMATIASAVGGSKGTLYGYFASKEEVFGAFVVTAGQQRWEDFIALPQASADIRAKLRALGQNYLRLLLSDEIMSVNRLVIAEAVRFPELGRIFYEIGPNRVINVIAHTLEEAADNGQLDLADPEAAAWRFKALCESRLFEEALWTIHTSVSESEINTNVETACEIFLNIYRPVITKA